MRILRNYASEMVLVPTIVLALPLHLLLHVAKFIVTWMTRFRILSPLAVVVPKCR